MLDLVSIPASGDSGQNTRTRLPRSPPSSSAAGFVPSALAARRCGEGPRLTVKPASPPSWAIYFRIINSSSTANSG